MTNFHSKNFINDIIKFSPRQFEGETKTRKLILETLKENKISYSLQSFNVDLPKIKKVQLRADNKSLDCDGCSMTGGKIKGKEEIISSLASCDHQGEANINFNPECPAISNVEYFFVPAISVSHESLKKILKAKKIEGSLEVTKKSHKTANILTGNTENPEYICFAHYDSIKKGAIDNASGVATIMKAMVENPDTLKNTLYVFSACEELSYDQPVYWGYGFREFEKEYYQILNRAKKILVIDSVGHSPVNVIKDAETVKEGFPIKNLDNWINKIEFLAGDLDKLMTVYHSELDDGRYLKEKYLKETKEKLINTIS